MSALLLSCEHGGNEVPADLRPVFTGHEAVLQTHRGYDIGALNLFRQVAPLAEATTFSTLSRLCIELNRSEHHHRLFSPFTKGLQAARKEALLTYYRNYRSAFADEVDRRIKAGTPVLHVAVHSFTPELDGAIRDVDIGLLYDPSRSNERAFCRAWGKAFAARLPGLRVRMNQPYKGISDGFPTALRKQFPELYAGIELEVNQRFAKGNHMDPAVVAALRESLAEALAAGRR